MTRLRLFIGCLLLLVAAGCKPYGDGVGIYFKEGSKTDYTELRADGTYSFHEGGKTVTGRYSVSWNTITLVLPGGKTATGKLSEDRIIDNQLQKWIKQSTPKQ